MDDFEALEDVEDLEDDIFFSSDEDDDDSHSGAKFRVLCEKGDNSNSNHEHILEKIIFFIDSLL